MIRNPLQFIHLSSLKEDLLKEHILTICTTQGVILSLDRSPYNRQHYCCMGTNHAACSQQCSVLCFKNLSVLLHALHFTINTINEHAFQFTQEITKPCAKSCIPYYATLIYTAVHGRQSKLTEWSYNTAYKGQSVKTYRTKTGKLNTIPWLYITSNFVGFPLSDWVVLYHLWQSFLTSAPINVLSLTYIMFVRICHNCFHPSIQMKSFIAILSMQTKYMCAQTLIEYFVSHNFTSFDFENEKIRLTFRHCASSI